MTTTATRHYVAPGEGPSVVLGRGIGVDFRISASDTGGLLSVVQHPIEPGTLIPPHTHHDTDELSYVVSGTIGARIGDDTIEAATAGSYVIKPRGVPHTFWNPGPEPALLVEMITPSGFETFFSELAAMTQDGPPDPAALGALGEKYAMSFHMDNGWVEELSARYGLSLNLS